MSATWRHALWLCALVPLLALAQTMTMPMPGRLSSHGAYLWPGDTAIADASVDGRRLSLRAPRGTLALRIGDGTWQTFDRDRALGDAQPLDDLAEVLWAPTGDAFAITASDGGQIGTWRLSVLRRDGSRVVAKAPSAQALSDFRRVHPHCPNEHPNVGAVAWSHDAATLDVVVEMPCHSPCVDMCRIRGYTIDAHSGEIRARLGEDDVRTAWRSRFGERFHSH